MTGSTSSAEPRELHHYSESAIRIDLDLLTTSHRLAGVLHQFEATCTEPGFRVRVSHVADRMGGHARSAEPVDRWVNIVGRGFRTADSRALPIENILWLGPIYARITKPSPSEVRITLPDWLKQRKWLFPIFSDIYAWIFKTPKISTPPQKAAPRISPHPQPNLENKTSSDGKRNPPKANDADINKFHPFVWPVPHVDQTTYSGGTKGAGEYLCSAAALAMALQYFLGADKVKYDDIANNLMKKNMLNKDGLLSGDYLARFVQNDFDKEGVQAQYKSEGFDKENLVKLISEGSLVVANVKGHYTLIDGYQLKPDGTYKFHVNDPYRGHWSPKSTHKALNNEWVTEKELSAIWEYRYTVVSKKATP